MTVADNIGITPQLLGEAARGDSARVDELLDLVRLDRRNIATGCRTNCPAASASGSASRGRSPPSRASC